MILFEFMYDYMALAFIFWMIVNVIKFNGSCYLEFPEELRRFIKNVRPTFFVEGFLVDVIFRSILYSMFTMYGLILCEIIKEIWSLLCKM